METDKQEAALLRIYIGESDLIDGRAAYKEMVHYFKKNGLGGATVIREFMVTAKRASCTQQVYCVFPQTCLS